MLGVELVPVVLVEVGGVGVVVGLGLFAWGSDFVEALGFVAEVLVFGFDTGFELE